MNIAIIDLDINSSLEQSAMSDLLGGCGYYFPQRCCAPVYCTPVYYPPVKQCGWGGWGGYGHRRVRKQFNFMGKFRRNNR